MRQAEFQSEKGRCEEDAWLMRKVKKREATRVLGQKEKTPKRKLRRAANEKERGVGGKGKKGKEYE